MLWKIKLPKYLTTDFITNAVTYLVSTYCYKSSLEEYTKLCKGACCKSMALYVSAIVGTIDADCHNGKRAYNYTLIDRNVVQHVRAGLTSSPFLSTPLSSNSTIESKSSSENGTIATMVISTVTKSTWQKSLVSFPFCSYSFHNIRFIYYFYLQ